MRDRLISDNAVSRPRGRSLLRWAVVARNQVIDGQVWPPAGRIRRAVEGERAAHPRRHTDSGFESGPEDAVELIRIHVGCGCALKGRNIRRRRSYAFSHTDEQLLAISRKRQG